MDEASTRLMREAIEICLHRTPAASASELVNRWWQSTGGAARSAVATGDVPTTPATEAAVHGDDVTRAGAAPLSGQPTIEDLREAQRLEPRNVRCRLDLAEALAAAGHGIASMEVMREAVDVDTGSHVALAYASLVTRLQCEDELVGAWCALGGALMDEAKHVDAMEAFQLALARKPDCLRARVGLGHALVAQGRPTEAIPHFEAGLAIEPMERWAHFGLGWSELLSGEFARGWKEMQWFNRSGITRHMDASVWTGEPLNGQTLLVWADWALGDTIQHLRFLPLVKSLGARVVVQCDKPLVSLVKRMPCVDLVVASGAPAPRHDLHVPLSSLVGIVCTTRDEIPASVPYLGVSAKKRAEWHARLRCGMTPTVGLVWTGDKSHAEARARFLTLADFRPLASVPNARFVSLQVGHPALEVAWEETLRVDHVLDETCSLEDTAAAILNLDLIITVDTMVAHLAGALGLRVWTLLPFAPAWLWPLEGDVSAWYPTLRIYRQSRAADWGDIMFRLVRDSEAR